MEAKDNRKGSASQIKRLEASKIAPTNYDRDKYAMVPLKNKSKTSVLLARRKKVKKTPKHSGTQCYCVLCKKAGMPECKWK